MTTSEALNTIIDMAFEYGREDDDDVVRYWDSAINHIIDQLNVVYDDRTDQWVSGDEGYPV